MRAAWQVMVEPTLLPMTPSLPSTLKSASLIVNWVVILAFLSSFHLMVAECGLGGGDQKNAFS